MLKSLTAILLLVQLSALTGCGGRNHPPEIAEESHRGESNNATVYPPTVEEKISSKRPLQFEIVEQKRVMKGGSLDPVMAPQYVLFDVKAALNEPSAELSELTVRTTLQALLNEVRGRARQRGEQIDGVSAYLYQSRDHIAGDSPALGRGEWWPKGHSFSRRNVANIRNKATYVEEIDVYFDFLPKPSETVVQRIPKDRRRAIFAELVRAQDRANSQAESKHPTDASKIPLSQLRTYDFKTAIQKKMEMEKELNEKYERELLQTHGLTEHELDVIKNEARSEQWPFPPP